MALFYNVAQRRVLAGEEKGMTKWFGYLKSTGYITFDKVCEQAALHSSVTHGDVAAVINGLLSNIANTLSEGEIAQLGRLGNFRLSAGSRGTNTQEEFRVHDMKRPKIVFTPGKKIKVMLKETGFKREPMKEIIIPREICPEHP